MAGELLVPDIPMSGYEQETCSLTPYIHMCLFLELPIPPGREASGSSFPKTMEGLLGTTESLHNLE